MRTERLRGVLNRLLPDGLTDGQLLARFIDGREEAAFAALVRRHGPMVLGVCRRVLGHAQDAEDAFQATFLVLARKAASVARREAVGAFLHGVAYRTALRAREKAARRRMLETQVESMPHPEVPPAEPQDWRPVLDRELNLLPDKLRSVLLLCDLEGKTRREAARQLGLPEGTVTTRLAAARRTLARRLARCGVVLSGGALAVALAGGASGAVPARLAADTVKAAALVAAGQAGGAGAPAVALMNEVLRSMLMNKLKVYLGAALLVVLIGAGGMAYRAAGQGPFPGTGGQGPMADTIGGLPAGGGGRPLTELELLRREVDILKARVDLLAERLRTQEAESRAPKGRPGGRPGTGSGMPPGRMAPGGMPGIAPGGLPGKQTAPQAPGRPAAGGGTEVRPQGQRGSAPGTETILELPAGGAAGGSRPGGTGQATAPPENRVDLSVTYGQPGGAAASPEEKIDAAVKAIREIRDEAARRRAVAALEEALQKLRQQRNPSENPPGGRRE